MTKSSLESLDPLIGSPDNSNSPSPPSPFPTINTTSDTTPSGNYLNHLHLVDAPAPTPTSLEENPSALAPAVTIAALLTHPTTTTTPNKTCPPHTTPVLTTLTPVLSGLPNPHHHPPLPNTNHHLSLNTNHHHPFLLSLPKIQKIIIPRSYLPPERSRNPDVSQIHTTPLS